MDRDDPMDEDVEIISQSDTDSHYSRTSSPIRNFKSVNIITDSRTGQTTSITNANPTTHVPATIIASASANNRSAHTSLLGDSYAFREFITNNEN